MKYRLTPCTFFAVLSLLLNVIGGLPEATAQDVDFPDSNLAAAVRGALGLGATDPIPQTALAGLTELVADNAGITDLTGLEHATGLTVLDISFNEISDVGGLSGLTNLTYLSLRANEIRDVRALSRLTNLTVLGLAENQISNVGGLSDLTNLTWLSLADNQLRDVDGLSGLTNLTYLDLDENQIVDVSGLSGLTNLTYLDLQGNQIIDVSGLSGLTNLTALVLWENQIVDVGPLSGLTNLTYLDLDENQIVDVSRISSLTNLTRLFLNENQIRDVRGLSGLTNLTALVLSENQIVDVGPLSDLTNLTRLFLNENQIRDVRGLSGLTNLVELFLNENQIRDVGPLSGLTNLTGLFLKENQIVDVSGLSGLTNLTGLVLWANQIVDVGPLSGLTNLTLLDLGGNQIVDASPLSGLTNLTLLGLGGNQIVDANPLSGLSDARIFLNPSVVVQDRVIFNEIHNARDDENDWVELKNISDAAVNLRDWEMSIVNSAGEHINKDVDFVAFPDYTLPAGGILLIVNTDPSETHLESGQEITDPDGDSNRLPQYLVAPEMRLPDTPYLLILRSATDKNGKPEAFEDLVGNYVRSFVDYNTDVWPLEDTYFPAENRASLTPGKAWRRVDIHARGYTNKAWRLSGHQLGIGYKLGIPMEESLGTPGYPNRTPLNEQFVGLITFSEIMFETSGGLFSQPQWIELYNNSKTATATMNLEDWKLVIEVRDSDARHRYSVLTLKALQVAPNRTVLLVTRDSRNRNSGNISEDRVYNLYHHHSDTHQLGLHENAVLSASGFSLQLYSPDGTLVDMVGNLDGRKRTKDAPKWELPSGRTEDRARTSLIRRYENNIALDGTEAAGWVRSADVQRLVNTYYGRQTDLGTPGYRRGGPLPVALSSFRSQRTEAGVIVEWTTASELNNAGFNILRSQTRTGGFVKVNPTLILGAGTTAEQNTYTWTDTTAIPNVAYYYRIEDVSFSGKRQQLATVRMRGYVSADGKSLQKWADLKRQQ